MTRVALRPEPHAHCLLQQNDLVWEGRRREAEADSGLAKGRNRSDWSVSIRTRGSWRCACPSSLLLAMRADDCGTWSLWAATWRGGP